MIFKLFQQSKLESKLIRPSNWFILTLLVIALFWLEPAAANAQAPQVQFTLNATMRYNSGISLIMEAKVGKGRLEKAELRYRLGKNSLEQARLANVIPSTEIKAYITLSPDQADLAGGMPVSYYWLVTTDSGQQVKTELKVIKYEDDRFQWNEVIGPIVTLRWYRGDERYGQQMYNLAADTLNSLKQRFAFQVNKPIYISVYASKTDFFQVAPANTPNWAGGYADLARNDISLIAPQDSLASIRVGEGVPHEVTHLALYQYIGRQLPRWFDEGLAVYNQNIKSEDYYRTAKTAFERKQLFDFDQLESRFPLSADGAMVAYAQGASFVDFLVTRYGDKVMANLFDQLRTKDMDEAMQVTFGVTQATLVTQWYNYLQGKPITLPTALKTGAITPLPVNKQPSTATNPATPRELSNGLLSNFILPILIVFIFGCLVVAALIIKGKNRREPKVIVSNPYYDAPAPYYPPPSSYQSYTSAPNVIVTPPPLKQTEPDPLDFIIAQFGKPTNPSD